MPKQISIDSVVDAALAGIVKSQNEYEEWSGGRWLWMGPEYLITVNVANEIAKIEGTKYITLENGASSAIEDAGAKGRGRLHNGIRQNGRFDILLWWADGTPRAVIEIKNQIIGKEQYEKDIIRIKECLRRNNHESTLQFGLFCFYESASDGRSLAIEKIQERLKKIKTNTKELLGDNFKVSLVRSDIIQNLDSAWCAACVLVRL